MLWALYLTNLLKQGYMRTRWGLCTRGLTHARHVCGYLWQCGSSNFSSFGTIMELYRNKTSGYVLYGYTDILVLCKFIVWFGLLMGFADNRL